MRTRNGASPVPTSDLTIGNVEGAAPSASDDNINAMEIDVRSDSTDSVRETAHGHIHLPSKTLGMIPLTILVFYNVSGGPFGCEAAVRAGGNRMTLIGFILGPIVWSLQEALLTAELGTTFPEAGAGVAWVEEAFGHNAGFMCGFLGWIAGATDNAIYPVLFLDYLREVLGPSPDSTDISQSDMNPAVTDDRPITSFVLLAVASFALGYVNWRGLDVVGQLSVWIAIIAMSPFVIMTVVGAFKVHPERWLEWPSSYINGNAPSVFESIQWGPYLNNLFWNLNSFDAAGSFAGEIEPAKFYKSMIWGTILVASCYIFPLLVAIGASPSTTEARPNDWEDGYLAVINEEVVGPWLGAWTVMAAGISNVALFQAELSADAFQLMGMADRGHIPKIFARRSRYGTPTFGIILGIFVILLMDFVSNLDQLIEMLNFNYAAALLMEYAAFFQLRLKRPDVVRPYRIPLGTFGCMVFFAPSILGIVAIMGLATTGTYIMFTSLLSTGFILIIISEKRKKHAGYDANLPVRDPDVDPLPPTETTGIASD